MSATSTTQNEAREAIYLAFTTAWGSTTALVLDNEDLKTDGLLEWARLSVRHTGSTQETLGPTGNRKFSRFGAAFVQIFTDLNIGTARADVLSTLANATFEGLSLADTTVSFKDVVVQEVGTASGWFEVLVEAEFEYTEIR